MNPIFDPTEPRLYLVRIWHADPGFRAAVRRVDSECTQWLESPQALAQWLADDLGVATEAPPGPLPRPGPA